MVKLGLVAILTLFLATDLEAYKFFQDRIPNGDNIPHPCKPNFIWGGVGHKNIAGGGDRNPFGLDFDANGKKWDRCICGRDSDGDGKTNGEELGDPDCTWTEGAIPTQTSGLSHPGICEPLDSPECISKNDWEFCQYETFTCGPIHEEGVQELTFHFPNTSVPAEETTYWCMTYELPVDQDYHIIAHKPQLDNQNVMHHAALLGCAPEDPNDESWKINSPTECGMAISVCRDTLAIWTVGLEGECFPEEYGFRIGRTGFKTVLMQFHWNNPEKRSDYWDGSGITIYTTPNLRANDAAVMSVGNTYLKIPPGSPSVTYEGRCSSNCTSWLPEPLQFSTVLFHMHYLGRSGALEHIRGNDIMELFTDATYSYDNPRIFRFENPLEFRAGDELKLTCNFKSTSRPGITYYGDGTADEMCFVFITYYPARRDFTYCGSHKSLELCTTHEGGEPSVVSRDGHCNYTSFLAGPLYTIMPEVDFACNSTTEKCPTACQEVIDRHRREQPCLRGDAGDFTLLEVVARYYGEYGRNWVVLFYSCDEDWDRTIVFREEQQDSVTTTPDDNRTPRVRPADGQCVFDEVPAGAPVAVTSMALVTALTLVALV